MAAKMMNSSHSKAVEFLPGVDFINPFMLCAKLLRSTPNFLRLKKASQKLGAERKGLAQSVNGFMKSTPASFASRRTF